MITLSHNDCIRCLALVLVLLYVLVLELLAAIESDDCDPAPAVKLTIDD